MANNIHIVTDSGSDLPLKVRQECNIHIVPLSIQFGDDIYRDEVDLSVEDFYDRLQNGDVMPSTCQPSPADFQKLYQEIAKPGDTIISIHLSSQLSGTYQSAVLASSMVKDEDINVVTVDSKSASIGIGVAAVTAAKARDAGATVEEILDQIRYAIDEMQVYFVVDTLEYLQRNGRIGKASALMGTLLNIKPILTLTDGVVAPFEKVRGKAKALKRIEELILNLKERYPGQSFRIGVTHSMSPTDAQAVADHFAENLPIADDIIMGLIGPTIGVHVGTGTIAVLLHPIESA